MGFKRGQTRGVMGVLFGCCMLLMCYFGDCNGEFYATSNPFLISTDERGTEGHVWGSSRVKQGGYECMGMLCTVGVLFWRLQC